MNINKFTQKVREAYAGIKNPRTNQLMQSLIQHLHDFVKENHLTESEWEFAWNFLAKMAAYTHAERNEFLLAADVLGVSQLVEILNHQRGTNQTGYALVGPFFRANAPFREYGACIASADTTGTRVNISGTVFDVTTGKPIPNAVLNIWQAADNGLYETQDPKQPDMNLRGQFTTDENGHYALVALMPTPYPVPTDGPVGEILSIAQRHPLRPAHIHFIVSAPDFEKLVTQLFVAGDEIVKTDVVFTASENMIGDFVQEGDHYTLTYDFQLTSGQSVYPEAPIK